MNRSEDEMDTLENEIKVLKLIKGRMVKKRGLSFFRKSLQVIVSITIISAILLAIAPKEPTADKLILTLVIHVIAMLVIAYRSIVTVTKNLDELEGDRWNIRKVDEEIFRLEYRQEMARHNIR